MPGDWQEKRRVVSGGCRAGARHRLLGPLPGDGDAKSASEQARLLAAERIRFSRVGKGGLVVPGARGEAREGFELERETGVADEGLGETEANIEGVSAAVLVGADGVAGLVAPTTHKFLGLSAGARARPTAEHGRRRRDYVGTEIDAQVIHPIGKGLAVRGLYALFLPNESYWNSDAPVHYVEAHFGWDF